MLRKWNRMLKGYLRKVKIFFGRLIWDKKRKLDKDMLIKPNNIIKENKINSILFLRSDGKIGDMVVSTFMFREIKKKYPDIKIGVITKGGARDIISNNPYVDIIYDYPSKIDALMKLAGIIQKGKYDLLLEFFEEIKMKEIMFINLCKVRINMGLEKSKWKLFDLSVDAGKDFKWNEHISYRYLAYLKRLGILVDFKKIKYDIYFDNDRLEKLDILAEKYKKEKENYKKIVVVNPYGASKHRNFSRDTLNGIINELENCKVILLYHGDKYKEVFDIAKNYDNVEVPIGIESILDSAMYVKISDVVISPDTAIVHVAEAFKKGVIGVYEYDGGILGYGHIVWGPKDLNRAKLVFCPKRKSMYDDFNVNGFDVNEMKNIIEKIK
ncbi:MAG: lipopolysaccharide heptosyltransferase family protein [Fusobacteriaceae bacterium]|jgi:ADP-heptose:LPS heptosyltransferase|nr:lipopolysaccharide heptosyltransferase family protein [Fusobacteriaceae bacterium]